MNPKPFFIFLVAIFHFFILFGLGHAGAFLGLSVFFAFDLVNNPRLPNLSQLSSADLLPFMGLFTIIGYLGLIFSILTQTPSRRRLYIFGIVFLWLSVLCLLLTGFYGYMISQSIFFCIPFLALSLYPFFGKIVGRMWTKANT